MDRDFSRWRSCCGCTLCCALDRWKSKDPYCGSFNFRFRWVWACFSFMLKNSYPTARVHRLLTHQGFFVCSWSSNFLSIYSLCESPVRLRICDLRPHLQHGFSLRLSHRSIIWYSVRKNRDGLHRVPRLHRHKHAHQSHLGRYWASQFHRP